MNDTITQITERWAACEGFLSARVSTTEEDTDLEYRGRAGKWTLATVFDTDEPTAGAWVQAFLHAREDVQALLAEIRRLQASADKIPWRRLPEICAGDAIGIHCRTPHPSGMYECLFCGEVGA